MNKLRGMRCYLIGAMDRVADNGAEWRDYMTPLLQKMGVIVLNPCDKPIDIGLEGAEDRKRRKALKEAGDWETLSKEIHLLRIVDLRMVDISDFIICYLDTTIHHTGTYEEFFLANRQKRPIIVNCKQGKGGIPDWLFGVCPHQLFFGQWSEVISYLDGINNGTDLNHLKRWMFFDYSRLTPEPGMKITV